MTRTPTTAPEPGLPRRRLLQALALLAPGAGLLGCGGGGEPATTPAASPSQVPGDTLRQPLRGIDSGGTGRWRGLFVSAPVAAVAPLTLRGQAFDTSTSTLVDGDGQPLALAALRPGMGCEVTARQWLSGPTPGAAVATAIRVAEQLRGPVAAVDVAAGAFTLLGQTVVVTSGTLWDDALPGGLAALATGQALVVWGQLDVAGGRTVATRLAPADAATLAAGGAVVRGVLAALDRQAGTARIGGLPLAVAAGDGGVLGDDLAVGQVVRARLQPAPGGTATLLALRSDALLLPDKVAAELEGRITRVDSALRFAVDGVDVQAAPAAWQGAALQPVAGLRVAVQGQVLNGLLVASQVQAESDDATEAATAAGGSETVELEGLVAGADAAGRRFQLQGVAVQWSAGTVFSGGGAALLTPRRPVAVLGRWNADRSALLAERIHVER